MKLIIASFAIVLFAQQQKGANSDSKYEEKMGISVAKPPKNDEWDFKDKGFFTNTKLAVVHKVDELGFDIMYQAAPTNGGTFDLKKVCEDSFNNMSGLQGVTEPKRIEMKAMKLPGNGYQAWYLEMTLKRADKLMEFRQWSFVGRENQQLYMIALHGDEGMYKKHQKVVDFILGSLKTWKLPK